MKMRQFMLTTSALVALAGPALAVDTEFYGQVNKALMWLDDANGESVKVGDNSVSTTRFGWRAEQTVGQGLTASVLLEMEVKDGNESRFVDNNPVDAASVAAPSAAERHARVGLAGDFGALFLGRTSSATDGITELDLGGTSDIMYSDVAAIGGDLDLAPGVPTFRYSDHFSNLEGFAFGSSDRVNLVRYDSPVYNGFQGSAALANGGDFDAALRYDGEVAGLKIKAGLGYANFNQNNEPASSQTSGAIAVKHKSGWNVAFAYGERDLAGLDTQMDYVKVGYDLGPWAFAVDRGTAQDVIALDREAEAFGVGAQYNWGQGVSSALLFRQFEAESNAIATDQARVVAATLRVKF